MFTADQYQLLDFGAGRKLERFGDMIVDRPSPAAHDDIVGDPARWTEATARYGLLRGGGGEWLGDTPEWSIRHDDVVLTMRHGASGNVGVFPEQANNWDWVSHRVGQASEKRAGSAPRVLNLFAYTGGATLAAATAGAEVTHVDASAPTVAWAKQNAAASDLDGLPIRWIVDDAIAFVAREARRGSVYDGIIADPPTYGHGPKGKAFKFNRDLGALIEGCARILDVAGSTPRFLLFSCHAPGFDVDDATSTIAAVLPDGGEVTGADLCLEAADGRTLPAGVCARWTSAL